MSSMLSTVSKDYIKPKDVAILPFIDTDVASVIIPIRSEREAKDILRVVRGF